MSVYNPPPSSGSSGITALTGDVSATGPGSVAATLATVNSNVGSFTNANITVNAKGLITAAANGSSSGGITSINTDATAAQTLTVGTSGTDFAIVDNGTGDHKFNLPTASASNRGALSSTDWSTFNNKGSGTVTAVSVATANGFSGSSSGGTTPSLTIVAGAITPSSVNGVAISGSSTPTLAVTGTTTVSGSNTGDQTSVSGNAGTATALQNARTIGGTSFNGTANIAIGALNSTNVGATTSAQFAGVISDETGSGALVFATSPTLITPILGAATATTINGLALTSSTGTLTIANGKTLTVNNSITLAGTDSTTMNFPSTTATIARTDAAQTFTGTQTFSNTVLTANAITASSNAATIPVTSGRNIVTNNSAATITITLTTTSAVNMQMVVVQILDFSAVAQTITWINTENSTVTVPGTSNGSTSLPLTVGFIYNASTSKWRCIALA